MKYQISAIVVMLLSLIVVASVFAVGKIYTKEEFFKKGGFAYDKKSNKEINGTVRIYHESGELKGEIPFKEGLPNGDAKYYYTSGALQEERAYLKGKLFGITREYNEDGSVLSERIFENNRLISGFLYDEKGDKAKISSEMIQDYNSFLPDPIAAKEAEVVKKIQAVIKSSHKPEYDSSLTFEERFKKGVDFISKAFEQAGYNYYDTINKVSDDLKNHRDRVPDQGESRHKMIIMLMAVQKSECQYQKVDCLQLYPPGVRDSVKWLWGNTGWSM